MRLRSALAVTALTALFATPALAHGGGGGAHWGGQSGGSWHGSNGGSFQGSYGGGWGGWGWGGMPGWGGSWQAPYVIDVPQQQQVVEPEGPPPQNREDWLRECRHRLGDNGVGGAVIGGVVGGVAGNVIAGHGDKVLGTVAGAAVGAVAGAAIDKAEDKARVRDRCEAMLEGGPAYGGYPAGYGYGYGYGYGTMLVPVVMVPAPGPAPNGECKETVTTTEYVSYEPRRSRHIPPRAPDKRVRIAPDKRVTQ